MVDRDHSDHISRLSNKELQSLHKSLISLKETVDRMDAATKSGESIQVEGPFGTVVNVTNGNLGWRPDLGPVYRSLDRVYEEMIERELLRDDTEE